MTAPDVEALRRRFNEAFLARSRDGDDPLVSECHDAGLRAVAEAAETVDRDGVRVVLEAAAHQVAAMTAERDAAVARAEAAEKERDEAIVFSRECFEMARKRIVSDEPPSEEAMRYGREVVAPRLEAEAARALSGGKP